MNIKAITNKQFIISSKDLGNKLYLLYYITPDDRLSLVGDSPVVTGAQPLVAWDLVEQKIAQQGFEMLFETAPKKDSQWTFVSQTPGKFKIVFVEQNEKGYFNADERHQVVAKVTVVD